MRAGAAVRLRRVRELLPAWTVRDVRAQYRQSAIDIGWSLLTPVATLAGYGFVLTKAFGVDGSGVPYLSFAWCGIVVWSFLANGVLRGTSSLVGAADLVRKVAFPKEVVPLSAVLATGLDLVVGLVILVVLAAVQGVVPTVHAIAVVPVLGVCLLIASAWATLLSIVSALARDAVHAVGVAVRIGIFVTPVMYPITQFPERYRWFTDVNPAAVCIEAVRDCLLRGEWPGWGLLGLHALAALVVAGVAMSWLARVEGRIADVI